jgi:hypothetical protein
MAAQDGKERGGRPGVGQEEEVNVIASKELADGLDGP